MKKIAFTIITLFLPFVLSKAFVQIDGIYYNLNTQIKTAEVTYGPFHYDYDWGEQIIRDFYYKGDVVIPDSVIYEGVKYNVTSIVGHFTRVSEDSSLTFPGAFEDCSDITSITIPSSIASIGSSAFEGCKNLQKVIVPVIAEWCRISFENVTSNPLYYAKHLYSNKETKITDLVIPNNVTSIGSYAFYGCSDLTSITIPNSVTSIGIDVFANTPWFNSQPDGLVYAGLIAYKYKGMMPSNTSIVIKEGTKGIAGNAFSNCSGLTSILIPYSVTTIGSRAFWGCDGITSISIPNSVTYIGSHAFWGCSDLTSITIPNDMESIEQGAFSGCTGLTFVTIPNCVKSISDYAFSGCSGISSIIIPNNVSSIGRSAFEGCSGLKSVIIGNSVSYIDEDAFSGCNGITTITIHAKEIGNWFSGKKSIKEIIIGKDVISIGSGAFSYCKGLTSVIIPSSVTSIGSYAFRGCSDLASVIIPDSLTSIGSFAFEKCSGLTSVTIPSSVKSIGDWAFSGCNGMTTISLYCPPNSLGNNTFDKCDNVNEITIDWDTISFIPFSKTKINKIVLKENVKSIEERAFANIDKLNDLYCYAYDVPKTDRTAFENSYIDFVTLHVPKESFGNYKTTAPWSGFKQIVAIEATELQEKCAVPTIDYKDGKLVYNCQTYGAECVTTITSADVDTHYGNEVNISFIYNINVFAKAEGYADSDVISALLIWIEKDNTMTRLNEEIEATSVLIQTHEGTLYISGAEQGTVIEVYNVSGDKIAEMKSGQGTTQIETSLNIGDIAIVKIDKQTVKVVMK